MGSKVLLALTVVIYFATGQVPRMREMRNPDAEFGGGRLVATLKRHSV